MNTDIVQALMKERLPTAERMREAANKLGVSLATLYRYKSDPSAIPFGKLIVLSQHLNFPMEAAVTWAREDVVQGERRRLELEQRICECGGWRCAVTGSYTVNAELPDVTKFLWERDYGRRKRNEIGEYVDIRAERSSLYFSGGYRSREIISAEAYRDFFNKRGRFTGLPERLRKAQVASLLKAAQLKHVDLRVKVRSTPEMPPVVCYSNHTAYLRIDDLKLEFAGKEVAADLARIVSGFFDEAELSTKSDVLAFLSDPTRIRSER